MSRHYLIDIFSPWKDILSSVALLFINGEVVGLSLVRNPVIIWLKKYAADEIWVV